MNNHNISGLGYPYYVTKAFILAPQKNFSKKEALKCLWMGIYDEINYEINGCSGSSSLCIINSHCHNNDRLTITGWLNSIVFERW